MTSHLFTYGSLMYDAVWSRVVEQEYRSMPATLVGYARRRVNRGTYPALIPARNDQQVYGRLYFNVNPGDLARLDTFEGAQYQRHVVRCRNEDNDSLLAHTYIFRKSHRRRVSRHDWDTDWFESTGIHQFLRYYRGFR